MILNNITFTGADETVSPIELINISKEYPFIEWGILFSIDKQGKEKRYPSIEWISELLQLIEQEHVGNKVKLSAHICGQYVRDLMIGENTWMNTWMESLPYFSRVQINSGVAIRYPMKEMEYIRSIRLFGDRQIITQSDGMNVSHLILLGLYGFNVASLIDKSGGTGKTINNIFYPEHPSYWGYAGGLNPDNIELKLEEINNITDKKVWIDMESGIRNKNDAFSIEDCITIVECSKKYVNNSFVI
jgi:hypothetical protein